MGKSSRLLSDSKVQLSTKHETLSCYHTQQTNKNFTTSFIQNKNSAPARKITSFMFKNYNFLMKYEEITTWFQVQKYTVFLQLKMGKTAHPYSCHILMYNSVPNIGKSPHPSRFTILWETWKKVTTPFLIYNSLGNVEKKITSSFQIQRYYFVPNITKLLYASKFKNS